MLILRYLKEFLRPVLFLIALLAVGTIGYMNLEGWNFIDSLYMTVITITTTGFGEINPLSPKGRVFTMLLLLSGVSFYGVVINSLIKNVVDIKLKDIVKAIKMKNKIEKLIGHFIICGGGRMAYTIGMELERSGKEFVFIENNPESPVMENKEKWLVIQKDALLEETLIEAGIERAAGLAAVLQTDADNLFVVLSARRLKPKLYIVTRIAFESTKQKMLQAGADKVVSPYTMGGMQIARSFVNPEINDFLEVVLDKASFDFEFKLHKITKYDLNNNKSIKNANYRKNGFIVISIKDPEGNLVFAPDANYMIREGSEILLLGTTKAEE